MSPLKVLCDEFKCANGDRFLTLIGILKIIFGEWLYIGMYLLFNIGKGKNNFTIWQLQYHTGLVPKRLSETRKGGYIYKTARDSLRKDYCITGLYTVKYSVSHVSHRHYVASSHKFSLWVGYIVRLSQLGGSGSFTCSNFFYLSSCGYGKGRWETEPCVRIVEFFFVYHFIWRRGGGDGSEYIPNHIATP